MCEHFVARAAIPFRIDDLWPFAEKLERFGIAGFGWGAAWLTDAGSIASHRDLRAFRDDAAGRDRIGRERTRSLLVHLRRPSRLSTLTLPDTQPFMDPEGRFAFSHNGDLRGYRPWRARYRDEGRILGRADTEVGARWLEDEWSKRDDPADALAALHETFGGQANLAVLTPDGAVRHYAGNSENPVFAFCLGPIRIASTGIYSLDRSLFRYVVPSATDRSLIREGSSVTFE
jgi:glutamine phosphoribosylpyrophosphate amidotransferase